MPEPLTVLFCADPLTPHRVDPQFGSEARAVRDLGGTVALVDHDAVVAGDARAALRRVPRDLGPAWYRGWMLTSPQYGSLATALGGRGVLLHTSPDQYRIAHELPGWYPVFAEVTPSSVWTASAPNRKPAREEIAELIAPLGPGRGIVKDYVKSRKHEWDEACFVRDLTDIEAVSGVITRMIELQEDGLNGGIVVRRFEEFRRHERGTVEARVWWLDGKPTVVGPHPDGCRGRQVPAPDDLEAVARAVTALGCRWITTDLAQLDDGRWRVIEVGDAQVSGWPEEAGAAALFEPLIEPGAPGRPADKRPDSGLSNPRTYRDI